MASTDEGRRHHDGPAALGELLRAHADDVADAVLERELLDDPDERVELALALRVTRD